MFMKINGRDVALSSVQDVTYFEEKYTYRPSAIITLTNGETIRVRGSGAVAALRNVMLPHTVVEINDDDSVPRDEEVW